MRKIPVVFFITIVIIGLVSSCAGPEPTYESEQSSIIGTRGPAGGFIVYDKGEYSDGWRFLEAASRFIVYNNGMPTLEHFFNTDYDLLFFGFYGWGEDDSTIICTPNVSIGSGKENTELLVAGIGDGSAVTNPGTNYTTKKYCAKACADLVVEYNGVTYDDWFLPSKDELNLISGDYYLDIDPNWTVNRVASSSTIDEDSIWCTRDLWDEKASREGGFLVLPFRRY